MSEHSKLPEKKVVTDCERFQFLFEKPFENCFLLWFSTKFWIISKQTAHILGNL